MNLQSVLPKQPKPTELQGLWRGLHAVPIMNEDTCWLIGPYRRLTDLATALRTDAKLRETLTELRVRIGLRKTDVPPDGDRQTRFGDTIQGSQHGSDFTSQRTKQLANPALILPPGQSPPVNRRNDREENVRTFWMSLTPQSHHIVEFNNLRDIGVSTKEGTGEMDYNQLPAVLLAAEFHQAYISSFLRRMHGMSAADLRAGMRENYRTLYCDRSRLFQPLWHVSRALLGEAGLPVGN